VSFINDKKIGEFINVETGEMIEQEEEEGEEGEDEKGS